VATVGHHPPTEAVRHAAALNAAARGGSRACARLAVAGLVGVAVGLLISVSLRRGVDHLHITAAHLGLQLHQAVGGARPWHTRNTRYGLLYGVPPYLAALPTG